jgi:large subunit ribosomal protein L23
VLVISDQVDDNLDMASRNLAHVLVIEPRYANPVWLMHYKKVLVAPIVSEKATLAAEKSNAVAFKVLRSATKPEIKAAVELLFNVQVKGVSVANLQGKTKRFGRTIGRRDHVRKEYVVLKEGETLNLSGEAA